MLTVCAFCGVVSVFCPPVPPPTWGLSGGGVIGVIVHVQYMLLQSSEWFRTFRTHLKQQLLLTRSRLECPIRSTTCRVNGARRIYRLSYMYMYWKGKEIETEKAGLLDR